MTLAVPIRPLPLDTASAAIPTATTTPPAPPLGLADAASSVYDCEMNLHHARQSGIDAWVSAAYDHLHLALKAYGEASRH